MITMVRPRAWGPMITTDYRAGHEVTRPVYVEGAEIGDAAGAGLSRGSLLVELGLDQLPVVAPVGH